MLKSLPSVVRIPLKVLASAGFATVTIILCILVLAWSTFLVDSYDLSATTFGVYNSWWFALLLLLLGINVFASMVVKLPWRRSQTGFLVVHAGIIVLLVGCWLTWRQGVFGQLGVAEGSTSSTVMEDVQYFKLTIADITGEKETKTVEIPFRSGPFNWSDYATNLNWFPWSLAIRDQGTIYDQDGVKLEVLDYMSDSEMVKVPELVLRTRPVGARMRGSMEEGSDTDREEFTLSIQRVASHGMMDGRELVLGSHHQLPTGELITFNYVDSQEAVQAFLEDQPEPPLGPLGQVVLRVTGKSADSQKSDFKPGVYRFSLAKMIEDEIVEIGDTSLRAQVTQFIPMRMQVRLAIYDKEKPGVRPRIVSLSAFQPSFDVQDPTGEVVGSFWFSAPQKEEGDKDSAAASFLEAIREVAEAHPQVVQFQEMSPPMVNQLLVIAGLPRVDLIQGPAESTSSKSTTANFSSQSPLLYFREWSGKQVTSAGPFNPHAKKIEWFAESRQPVSVQVVQFTPSPEPSEVVQAIPYTKESDRAKKQMSRAQPRVKVRLTVGDASKTFWLSDLTSDTPPQWKQTMVDDNKSVTIKMRRNETQLGFGVHLDDFTVEYLPGSPMPFRYSSQVDFVKPNSKSGEGVSESKKSDKAEEAFEEDVLIRVNHPADVKDPSDGRAYRLFQTSFRGPIRPGEPAFEQFVGGNQKRDTLYLSYFTVTYDPGRFWKYAGCFMIVFGIAIMYYMKAYFFKRFSSKMKEDI